MLLIPLIIHSNCFSFIHAFKYHYEVVKEKFDWRNGVLVSEIKSPLMNEAKFTDRFE